MLKKRLITVLTFNDGVLFRTKVFEPDYRYTHQFVDLWNIDEVVILDITREATADRKRFYEAVKYMATHCRVPITAGGRVESLDEIQRLLKVGADKVVINRALFTTPEFVRQASRKFGTQCLVGSIDVKKGTKGQYEVYTAQGKQPTGKIPWEWAQEVERLGVGEILVSSIDRDGSLEGYDNFLNKKVSQAVKVPVVVCGGAGQWQHFVDGFNSGKADGVCTTNIYHFTEDSIKSAKQYLLQAGVAVRDIN